MKLARCLLMTVFAFSLVVRAAAFELPSEVELEKHDEFVDLISRGRISDAVASATPLPSDAPEAQRSFLEAKRKYDTKLVEAVLRDLGPVQNPERLGPQPEDGYYFSWRSDTNDNNSGVVLSEICYAVDYAYYGKGYVFTRSLEGELVGFGFALGMSDPRAHARWADIQDTLTEIQRADPYPVPPRRITSP